MGGAFVTGPNGLGDVNEPRVPTHSFAMHFEPHKGFDPFAIPDGCARNSEAPSLFLKRLDKADPLRQAKAAKFHNCGDAPVVHFQKHIDVLGPATMPRHMRAVGCKFGGVAVFVKFFEDADDGIHCARVDEVTRASMLTPREGLAKLFFRDYLPRGETGKDVLMGSIYEILMLLIGVARTFIFAHFIMSWLISFNVLNVHQQFVGQVWYTLQRILDPIYRPIRRFMPDLGGIDLSPIVALLGLEIIRIVLHNNQAVFF